MGSRRFNLFVILFVVGLLIGSGLVIVSKETKLGLDLRGGTQLIYEAEGTPQNPEPGGEDINRAIEIVRDRVDALGVAEPEISQLGELSLQVNLPDVQDIERAKDQVGTTAQLFFYDLEPNIVPLWWNQTCANPVSPFSTRPYNSASWGSPGGLLVSAGFVPVSWAIRRLLRGSAMVQDDARPSQRSNEDSDRPAL